MGQINIKYMKSYSNLLWFDPVPFKLCFGSGNLNRVSLIYSTQLSRDPDEDLGEDQTWTEFDSIEHNQLYCFFCDAVFNNSKELNNHLYTEHDFEFEKIKGT